MPVGSGKCLRNVAWLRPPGGEGEWSVGRTAVTTPLLSSKPRRSEGDATHAGKAFIGIIAADYITQPVSTREDERDTT